MKTCKKCFTLAKRGISLHKKPGMPCHAMLSPPPPFHCSNTTSWLAFLERMSRKYRMPSEHPTTPVQSPMGVISVEPPSGYSSIPGQAGGSLTVPGAVPNASFTSMSEENDDEWEDEDEDDEEEEEDWETDEG